MGRTLYIAITCLITSVPSLAISAEKSAQSHSLKSTISQLKETCKSDLKKYCSDITPGEGRVAACLDSREDQLSSKCQTAYLKTKARVSRELDKTEVAFRKSCGEDVKRFCSEVPSGRGRILNCLDENKDGLSESCVAFENTLKDRLSTLMG